MDSAALSRGPASQRRRVLGAALLSTMLAAVGVRCAPAPETTPNSPDDQASAEIERLMRQFLGELFGELSPNATPDPSAPDGGNGGLGA